MYSANQSPSVTMLGSPAGQLAYHLTDYGTAVEHLETAIAVATGSGSLHAGTVIKVASISAQGQFMQVIVAP